MTETEQRPPGPDDEDTLVRRAMLGEAADFARLVTNHYARIYRLAYRFTGRRDDAEDVAQEACIKLAHHLASFRFEAPFAIWLSRMTMNCARDYLRVRSRKQAREMPLFEDADWVEESADPERQAAARQQLARINDLPEQLRDTIILVFGEGMSHAEAALALGCAESTISWRIHEARKMLRDESDKTATEGAR